MAVVPYDRNIAENFNRLSTVHERYRQTTDRQTEGRTVTYSERDHKFNIANICTKGPQSLEPQGPRWDHDPAMDTVVKV